MSRGYTLGFLDERHCECCNEGVVEKIVDSMEVRNW